MYHFFSTSHKSHTKMQRKCCKQTLLCVRVCDRGRKHTHAFLTEQFLSGTKEAMSLFNWTREEFANLCGFASTPSSLTNVNSSFSQTLPSLRSGTVVHNVLCSFFSNYFAAGAMYLWKRKPPKWQCSYCLWPCFWVITDLICSEEEISKIFQFGTGIELLGYFGWFIIIIIISSEERDPQGSSTPAPGHAQAPQKSLPLSESIVQTLLELCQPWGCDCFIPTPKFPDLCGKAPSRCVCLPQKRKSPKISIP